MVSKANYSGRDAEAMVSPGQNLLRVELQRAVGYLTVSPKTSGTHIAVKGLGNYDNSIRDLECSPGVYDITVSRSYFKTFTTRVTILAGRKVEISPALDFDPRIQWKQLKNGLTNINVYCIGIDERQRLYAGTGNGVFVKSANADSWSFWALKGLEVRSLSIDPKNSDIVYVALEHGGVVKTTNGGASWHRIDKGLPNTNVNALAVDPRNNRVVYAGPDAFGIWRTIDGGSNWRRVGPGRDVRSFSIDLLTTGILYASTSTGIMKTVDLGTTWYSLNSGLPNPFINGLSIDPTKSEILFAGPSGRGVWKSVDGGATWFEVNNELTKAVTILAFIVHPQNSQIVYAASDAAGVFQTIDGGLSWSPINNGLGNLTIGRHAVVIDPNDGRGGVMYVGTVGAGVFTTALPALTILSEMANSQMSSSSTKFVATLNCALDSGVITVRADSPNGASFENSCDKQITVQFKAAGRWSFRPAEGLHGASGHTTYPVTSFSRAKYRVESAPPGSLVIRRQGGSYQFVGDAGTLILHEHETVAFVMNDEPNGYWDNRGSVEVSWRCIDCE
jgi:photosystem II stability/assembly factor-like uncharacterized protein